MPTDPDNPAPTGSLRELLAACDFEQGPALEASLTAAWSDIQWRADRCTPSSILCFQRFDDGRPDAELIERYLLNSAFGALVVNRPLQGLERLGERPVFVTAPGSWHQTLK
ncbi:MAG: hypothetical protein GVY22_00685, partial [Gammaproteobacteria bacterium]|nr:hypothetical protein [Gammaproteobacteria bacterium]